MTQPASLRERKKDSTRRSLAETALRLAVERGYEHVTIADVVDEVGVSRRTFSNYFANKAECVVAVCDGLLDDTLEAIRIQPADATPDQVLEAAVLDLSQRHEDPGVTLADLVGRNPELGAHQLAWDEAAVAPIAAAIAERLGLDRDDIRLEVVARFGLAAGRTCMQRWTSAGRPGGTAGFTTLLRQAFSVLDLNSLSTGHR